MRIRGAELTKTPRAQRVCCVIAHYTVKASVVTKFCLKETLNPHVLQSPSSHQIVDTRLSDMCLFVCSFVSPARGTPMASETVQWWS